MMMMMIALRQRFFSPLLFLSTACFAVQAARGHAISGIAGPDSRWCSGKEAFDEQRGGSYSGLSPAFVKHVIDGGGGRNLRSSAGDEATPQQSLGGRSSSERALQDQTQVGPVPQVEQIWPGSSAEDLYNEYYNIFKYGNRNAASHLWSRFLLERSAQMDHERFAGLFGGFCPVSGSPVSPGDHNRYLYQLDKVDGSGAKAVGFLHHCCWPCICDTRELIKVDTATVPLAGGNKRTYNFLVIGNPCSKPEELTKERTDAFSRGSGRYTLQQSAPEVRCDEAGNLINAPLSDHGYVIIGMLADFPEQADVNAGRLMVPPLSGKPNPGRTLSFAGRKVQDEQDWDPTCAERAAAGYNSGMGTIFRAVAQISPIATDGSSTSATPTTKAGATADSMTEQPDEPVATSAAAARLEPPPLREHAALALLVSTAAALLSVRR